MDPLNPQQREEVNLATFIEPEQTPLGEFTLRPLSLGSFCILKQIKSEFLIPRGQIMENGPTMENEFLAAAEYVYIHAAALNEVRSNALDPVKFKVAVLEFADKIPIEKIPEIIGLVEKKLEAIDASHFEVIDKPGSNKPEIGVPPKS